MQKRLESVGKRQISAEKCGKATVLIKDTERRVIIARYHRLNMLFSEISSSVQPTISKLAISLKRVKN